MNFALVTETFPPEINGVAMTLRRIVEGLSRRGHKCLIVCPQRSERMASDFPGLRIEQVFGCPIPKYENLRFGFPAVGFLRRVWREFRPDIVHAATEGPLGWSAIHVARSLKIPTISSYHTNFHSYGHHYGYAIVKDGVLTWMRLFHNATRRTFVPSQEVRNTLEMNGFKNLSVLTRGVDTELFSPARRSLSLRESWGVAADDPVAVYVGRIAGEKSVPLAVEAFRRLQSQWPRAKMVLVGDGPERGPLSVANPDLLFAGMRTGEDLAAHYASGDVFLFGSKTETFGNVVTEAMSSRLVVLAFDYAAPHQHIIDGQSGFLAPYGDDQAFVERAHDLGAARDRWPEIATAARRQAESISWDSVLDGFEADLLKTVSAARSEGDR